MTEETRATILFESKKQHILCLYDSLDQYFEKGAARARARRRFGRNTESLRSYPQQALRAGMDARSTRRWLERDARSTPRL